MPAPPPAAAPRAGRVPALAAVLLAHAALIAWLVALNPSAPPSAAIPSLTLVPLPAPPVPAPELPPAPPQLALPSLAAPELPPLAADPSAITPASACAPLETAAAALAADPAVRAAVAALPPGQRSITGATIVWNAGWAPVAGPGAPLANVRTVLAQALAPLSPACLAQSVAGPRLLPVPIDGETRFLVFGSGEWRWADIAPPG